MIKSILSIVASILGIVRKRNEDKNASNVQKAARANAENKAVEAETKATAEEDEEQIRKNLSE
jgi:hypothetical protein